MRCCQATEVLLVLQLRENDFPSGMWQRGRFEVCKGRKALSTQHHIWTWAETFQSWVFTCWLGKHLPECFAVSCFAYSCPCCLSLYFALLLKQQMFSLSSKETSWHPSYHKAANPGCMRVAAQTVHLRVCFCICLQAWVPQRLFGSWALTF